MVAGVVMYALGLYLCDASASVEDDYRHQVDRVIECTRLMAHSRYCRFST
jgi:hypothetical protein